MGVGQQGIEQSSFTFVRISLADVWRMNMAVPNDD